MNCFPPASVANSSSGIGKGYWSTCRAEFTVILKSPHILILRSGYGTGTMGVAHSL